MGVLRRIPVVGLIVLVLCPCAAAQTMRFHTNVGTFDMRLNPQNDPNLQPLVDNIVAYIGLGRYSHTAINRAVEGGAGIADDFVLQMGNFLAFPTDPGLWAEMHSAVQALSPVVVDANGDGTVDFDARSNVRGTVSLALRQDEPNSGTSSFFINLDDNSSILDSMGFVPFATIQNLTTVNRIMQLMQEDLSQEAGQPGSAAYTDVPLTATGQIVVLEKVTVLQADPNFSFVGPIASALQLQQRNSTSGAPASAAKIAAIMADESGAEDDLSDIAGNLPDPGELSLASSGGAAVGVVPEPSALVLSLLAILAANSYRRRVG